MRPIHFALRALGRLRPKPHASRRPLGGTTTLRRAIRFAITGVGMTALHCAIALAALDFLRLSLAFANGSAFVISTLVSYLINTLWSFTAPLQGKTLQRFLTVSLLGLGLTMLIAKLTDAAGFSALAGIALVVLIVPPINFLAHHRWTYRENLKL